MSRFAAGDNAMVRTGTYAILVGLVRMILTVGAIILWTVNLIVRWGSVDDVELGAAISLLLSATATSVLLVSGYLGGTLVYDDDIAAGRHRRPGATAERTIVASGQASAGGLVAVADADSLAGSETLRIEVDGTVMTIANVGGECSAFQESCTHRFGPLSEGALLDGEIECPWRRSRFTMRTGNVTHSPAKIDLKTLDVAVRDGKILVSTGEARPADAD
jgi:nitrite reductase/ring-hydroxylating ferredoxin subunit